MYYDRTVSSALLESLTSGPFGFLPRLARTQHLADLQLRGYPKTKRCWATLYCGLTKVLDVVERQGSIGLRGVRQQPAWTVAWEGFRPISQWTADVPALEHYVDGAIRSVAARFTSEGAVQAMLCTRASVLFSVIDREAVIGFSNTAEREATYTRVRKQLHSAFPAAPVSKWLVPKSFGGELDLLAVDPAGRLLVIEIKPASSTAGITWAPLQATFYAELFRAWSTEHGTASVDSLESMLHQRISLGLTQDPDRRLRFPIDIVPVVAIGGRPTAQAIERMWTVNSSLAEAGVGWSSLEVWTVEESVARTRLEP